MILIKYKTDGEPHEYVMGTFFYISSEYCSRLFNIGYIIINL